MHVEDEQLLPLALAEIKPANHAGHIEPNSFISLGFNRAIDSSKLQVTVRETAHGFTYQRLTDPEDNNSGSYQLVNVDREFETVSGKLSSLPGNQLIGFYPDRELAYNATVFVTVHYDGVEMQRSQFTTRALPTFLDGGVLDQLGQPVAGITVSLPELKRSTVTGSNGGFSFGYGDSAESALPAGRYNIVVNPGMSNPAFGTLSRWVIIEAGAQNTQSALRLSMLNQQGALTPISGGGSFVLAKGSLSLDLTQGSLIFPDGSSQGLAMAQFSQFADVTQPRDEDFYSPWSISLQPEGIRVNGTLGIDIALPRLEGSHNWLPPEGERVLLLGTDARHRVIKPLGVGRIQGTHVISERNEFSTLDQFSLLTVGSSHQALLARYVAGEVTLTAMLGELRSALQLQRLSTGGQP